MIELTFGTRDGNRLPVNLLLELSTYHITPKDGELISTDDVPFRVAEHDEEYGVLFMIPDEMDILPLREFGMSREFIHIFCLAHEHGIRWLYLDADATCIPWLKSFEKEWNAGKRPDNDL